MPLWKTDSGTDFQTIPPQRWTFVRFDGNEVFDLPAEGWSIMEVILRVDYPRLGCPKTLRGRLVRWPGTDQEDETGHNDVNPIPGYNRHHHWEHFLINRPQLTIGFRVWHDGRRPIVLDGRQFKTTRIS